MTQVAANYFRPHGRMLVSRLVLLIWPTLIACADRKDDSPLIIPAVILLWVSLSAAAWTTTRSIAARRDPKYATSADALNSLDVMMHIAQWIAIVSLVTTAVSIAPSMSMVTMFGVAYQVALLATLVAHAERAFWVLKA